MATPTLDDTSGCGSVFADGDVIIKTSEHAFGIFVVHKDVLSAHSPVLAAILSSRWNMPRRVRINQKGKAIEIFELDLYFDHDTKLCLLTANKDSIKRQPADLTQGNLMLDPPDDPHATPQDRSTYRQYVTESLSRRPTPQFLWNEPQRTQHVTFSEEDGMHYADWPSDTYLGYLTAYEALFPPLQTGDDDLLRHSCRCHAGNGDVASHRQALAFGRSIWRALITLMYGRELIIQFPNHKWRREGEFIATLVVYCDYLGASDQVIQMLRESLRNVADLSRKTVSEPELLFHLAYRLREPQLYLDAAKHLIGMRHARHSGMYDPHSFSLGGSRLEAKYYIGDMMKLLLAGTMELQTEVDRTYGQLLQSSFQLRGLAIDQFLPPPERNGHRLQEKAKKAIEVYVIKARDLLGDYVIESFASRRIASFQTAQGVHNAATVNRIFLLKQICEGFDEAHVEDMFKVSSAASACGLDYDKLMRCFRIIIQHFSASFNGLKLLERQHSLYCGSEAENCWDPWDKHGLQVCKRCCQSRHEVRTHFTWLNHESLLSEHDNRPWPLGEDLEPTNEGFETQIAPAGYEYLELLGLGQEFAYLSPKLEHQIDKHLLDEDTLGDRLARVQEMFKSEEAVVDVPVDGSQGLLSYRTSNYPELAFYGVPLLTFLMPRRPKDRVAARAMKRSISYDNGL